MELIGQNIVNLLRMYGYPIMIPLMTIEGPITGLVASTLASVGVFNIFIVYLFHVIGDVLGDVVLFYLGRRYGMNFVNKAGKYIGITEGLVKKMEKYFEKHGGKTIFFVKITAGLCQVTWVAAGMSKMKFSKFMKYSVLGGIVWSAFIVTMGYFYGYVWKEVAGYINNAGVIIFSGAIFTIIMLGYLRNRQSRLALEREVA